MTPYYCVFLNKTNDIWEITGGVVHTAATRIRYSRGKGKGTRVENSGQARRGKCNRCDLVDGFMGQGTRWWAARWCLYTVRDGGGWASGCASRQGGNTCGRRVINYGKVWVTPSTGGIRYDDFIWERLWRKPRMRDALPTYILREFDLCAKRAYIARRNLSQCIYILLTIRFTRKVILFVPPQLWEFAELFIVRWTSYQNDTTFSRGICIIYYLNIFWILNTF